VGHAKTRKPNLPKSLELNKGLSEILPPLTFKVKQQLVFAMSPIYQYIDYYINRHPEISQAFSQVWELKKIRLKF